MTEEHFTIHNADGERIAGLIERVDDTRGFAIVQHGLGGHMAETHIAMMAACCVQAGWTTIRFDARHTFGQSDGDIADTTTSSYCADLADIIAQCVPDDQKLLLLGHSLGAASILKYAGLHPQRVTALAPTATIVSQHLYIENKLAVDPDGFHDWQQNGRVVTSGDSEPARSGRVSFNMVHDMADLRTLDSLEILTMPVFLAVGAGDTNTPPGQQKTLFDLWRGPKELHVYPGCAHTFAGKALQTLAADLSKWLVKLPV